MRTEIESPNPPLLEICDMRKAVVSKGVFTTALRMAALEAVSVQLDHGEALARVQETGSGKSIVARILVRLERPDLAPRSTGNRLARRHLYSEDVRQQGP